MANPFNRASAIAALRPQQVKGGVTASALLPAHQDGQPQFPDWDTQKAIDDGFKASTWVYACINRLMEAAASVPWHAYQKTSDTWEPVADHPLELLLEHPNPFMCRSDIIKRVTAQMYLGGNAMMSKITKGKQVVELWPIDVGNISVVPSRSKFIDRYEYDAGGVTMKLKPEEVVHMMFVDPSTPHWGMSPLQAVSKTVDTDTEAVKWNMVSLANRMVPDGVFIFEQSLTREQWEEARSRLRDSYAGADNARTPMIIGGKASWHPQSLSPAEMDFLNSRKFSREEICSVFGVPLPLIGLYENATLANIETARRIFWEDTIIPFLDGVRDALNRSLTYHFGDPTSLWLDYDLSDVTAVRDDYDAKVKTAREMWEMGIPINVITQKLELDIDDVEGGDIPFVSTAVQPLDVALGMGEDVGTPAPNKDKEPKPKPKPKKEGGTGEKETTEASQTEVLAAGDE